MNTAKVMNIVTKDVCKHLGISEEDIFWLQVERAGEFLEEWIGAEYTSHIALMKQTPEFWAWWRQTWSNRDKTMLAKVGRLSTIELQRKGMAWEFYEKFHSVNALVLKPNSVVMEGYHRMLKSITQRPAIAH